MAPNSSASSPCVTSPRWLFVIAHPFVNFKLVKDNSLYVARRLEDLSSGLYKSTSWSTHQLIPDIYNPSHHKSAARFEKWELNCQIECNFCDGGKKKLRLKLKLKQFPGNVGPLPLPQCERDGRLLPKSHGCLHNPCKVLHQRPGQFILFHTIPASCLWW